MSNKIVQLENEAGDNIYPLAGGALTGSISKTMLEEGVFEGPELSEPSSVAYVATDNIQDGAVTSDKIDWTTLPLVYEYTQRTSDLATTSETTIFETTFTSSYNTRMMFFTTMVMKTDRNTSFIRVYLDGTVIGSTSSTSSTTYLQKNAVASSTISAGNHTIKVTVIPQDGNTTVSVKAFERMYLVGWCV